MTATFRQVLTIDVEDWFHCLEPNPNNWCGFERRVEIGMKILFELLEETKSKATFFVLGEVARNHPEIVMMIGDGGHEVGSHGMYHRLIYNQSESEFERDLVESIELLSELAGNDILSYRAPYFSITKNSLWALKILKNNGIEYDSSIFPVINHRYGITNFQRNPHEIIEGLWEWPITTIPTILGNIPFSGGVYLRFLPLTIINMLINIIKKRDEPLLLYIHPWELDHNQPHIESISPFLKFRHYYALEKTIGKIKMILRDYGSCTILEYFHNCKAGINVIDRN